MLTKEQFDSLNKQTKYLSFLDSIEYEPLRELTVQAILKYSDEKKLKQAFEVNRLHYALLEFKNQVKANSRPTWVDLFVAAGYMHNMFYDGTVTSLFMAREKISDLAKELEIPVNGIAMLFSAIEGQFGDQTPVEGCIPNEASPNALFAKAVFVVDVYNGNTPLPNGTSY